MSSTNKTPNIGLSQFVAGMDRPAWLDDYNNDMSAIDTGLASLNREMQMTRTTQDFSVYVSTTGNNNTGDGTALSPFRTIAHAVSTLPAVINHAVTIRLAEGAYDEAVTLSGFTGGGTLTLRGGTNLAGAAGYLVNQVVVNGCGCKVLVAGIRIDHEISYSAKFQAISCRNVTFSYCRAISASAGNNTLGFQSESSSIVCSTCYCENLSAALCTTLGGQLYASGISGSGNSVGYRGQSGGLFTRGKNSFTCTTEHNLATGAVLFPAGGTALT